MIKFEPKIGQTSIKARDLDRNFARVQPLQNGQYGINQTEDGWSLNIFPPFPEIATEALALTYTGGAIQWRSLGELVEESEGGNGGGTISGGTISSPPSGTADWRQVERCDGKTMYVWGTEWA